MFRRRILDAVTTLLLLSPAVFVSAATPTIVERYKTWTQISPCYQDNNGGRALHHLEMRDATVSVSSCLDACAAHGYMLAGVEYGTECFCGNSIQYNNGPELVEKCSRACAGDPSQICGGSDALNMYRRGVNPASHGPATILVPSYKGFQLTGCWADDKWMSGGQRLLPYHPEPELQHEEVTVQKCIDKCAASGYKSAGLEWSQECWCGASGKSPEAQLVSLDECHDPCTADARQYCGGPLRLLVYTIN